MSNSFLLFLFHFFINFHFASNVKDIARKKKKISCDDVIVRPVDEVKQRERERERKKETESME